LLVAAACSRAPKPQGPQRIAFLPFENLTGDTSLDWVSRTAAGIAASDAGADKKVYALNVANINTAYQAKADAVVHGFFTRERGGLRFSAEVEDLARHKITKAAAADGALLEAMNRLSRELAGGARAFPSSNPAAVEAWGRGEYERAVTLDPGFGEAWLGWSESLAAKRDSAGAAQIAEKALAQPGLGDETARARIELLLATLKQDAGARRKAIAELARLDPTDPPRLAALAEAAMLDRDFAAAAETYRKVSALDPENSQWLNLLGYAQAFAGDLAAAQKSFERYGQFAGQKANALDSTGEAYFSNGQFAEAEKYFLEAQRQNPAFLGGVDLWKAAFARWLAGDLKGADSMMTRFIAYRSGLHDMSTAWREANWLWMTGRREQALAALQRLADRTLAAKQMAMWHARISEDPAALKQQYDRTEPAQDGAVRTFYAAALASAGEKQAARKLIGRWPLPGSPGDAALEPVLFAKFLELRKELAANERK
jgi:tetratricopeptide (TPR) repeat protein